MQNLCHRSVTEMSLLSPAKSGEFMKATSQYIRLLLQRANKLPSTAQRTMPDQRQSDLGLDSARRQQQPLPGWADAAHENLLRYIGGGVEAENTLSVG